MIPTSARGPFAVRHSSRVPRLVALGLLVCLGHGCAWLDRWFRPRLAWQAEILGLLHPHTYAVAPGATLPQIFADLERLAGVSVAWDPKLRAMIDQLDPRLPALRTLPADELLRVLREAVPPSARFDYEFLPNRALRLHLHYLPDDA